MASDYIKEIFPIPNIPNELQESSIIAGRVIPFIGAGLSKLAGCPSWKQFADNCLQFLVDKGRLNYCELEQLKDLSPRIKLSLAISLQDNDIQIKFSDMFPMNSDIGNEKIFV